MGHKWITRIIMMVLYAAAANGFFVFRAFPLLILPARAVVLLIHVLPGMTVSGVKRLRLRICLHGAECLVVFVGSVLLAIGWHIYLAFFMLPGMWVDWLLSALVAFCVEMVLFWNGILCVYLTSVQL